MLSIRRPAEPADRHVMASGERATICCAPEPAQPREVTVASRIERVAAPDGPFDLTVWLPEAGHGPGILLIQEIFGVGDYIRAVAEDLAELGYVVAAPDLFWRLKPGHQAVHDAEGVAESLELSSRFDTDQGVDDAAAALEYLAALPEVRGGLGVIGFCLGGSIAYFLAARTQLDAVVSFYGSEVPGHTDVLAQISAPIQFHFGGNDPYIPRDQVARVEETVRGTQNAEVHVEEDAGHAFHNRKAPMFHHPEPAARAWQRTEEFLARHLPVRHQKQPQP
jgi:carboxymethylenebutenolidase